MTVTQYLPDSGNLILFWIVTSLGTVSLLIEVSARLLRVSLSASVKCLSNETACVLCLCVVHSGLWFCPVPGRWSYGGHIVWITHVHGKLIAQPFTYIHSDIVDYIWISGAPKDGLSLIAININT